MAFCIILKMEIWKTIKDFNNYEVSSYGNVKRKKCQIIYSNGMVTNYKERLLKLENTRDNYKRVTFSQNNIQKRYQLHRLIAIYFIPNKENKPCVNHIDGDKSNNSVENLEWCSYSENEQHSYNVLGKINANRKLTEEQVFFIKTNAVQGKKGNIKKLSDNFNISVSSINKMLRGNSYV